MEKNVKKGDLVIELYSIIVTTSSQSNSKNATIAM